MQDSELLLSALNALIGHVTPNLRCVRVEEKNNVFILNFYYDKSPTDDEIELASLTDTEFSSDFPSPEYETDFYISTLPYPEPIPKNGQCVYRRYEE